MKTMVLSSLFFDLEKKAFWTLIALMLASIGAYVYFITASITNTVMRKNAAIEMNTLNTQVGMLEAQYMQRKTALNEAYATKLGYTAIADQSFVVKPETSRVTLNR